MTALPPPVERDVPVAERICELDALVGRERFVEVCVDLLEGAPRTAYVPELRYLTGHAWEPGSPIFDVEVWKDYWVRTWGARGLLYCWDDRDTEHADVVLAGLDDPEPWVRGHAARAYRRMAKRLDLPDAPLDA